MGGIGSLRCRRLGAFTSAAASTDRSTLFDCAAWHATATASTLRVRVAARRDVTACADALETQFGAHFATAFSLTSAARDVVTFVSTFQAHATVFLYGVGFGTHLVQRIMHFPSDELRGFVLDSVATTAGAKQHEFPFWSRADVDFGHVAQQVVALCTDDVSCTLRFHPHSLEHVLVHVLKQMDRTDPFKCSTVAAQLRAFRSSESASFGGTTRTGDHAPRRCAVRYPGRRQQGASCLCVGRAQRAGQPYAATVQWQRPIA